MSFLFPCYQLAAPRRSPEINAESPGEHPFPKSPIHYAELGGSLPPHLPHSSSLTLTARRRPFKFISPRPGQALSVKLHERERAERHLLSPVHRGGRGGKTTCPCEGLGKRLVRDTQLIMARINLLDLLPGGRRGVNTACAEAVWKHNVSVYRKNINTSSPLWVIDGGTGQGQPRAGRVTESQELARKMDPMEMNLRGHRSGQVALGTSDPPCSALHEVGAHSRYLPLTLQATGWGREVGREASSHSLCTRQVLQGTDT